ncbi:radical SAM family heme chaperone HemW [Pseudidiomarina sp. CB1]|uniref:radical SAM family heme chaperone HemW n=1 Tax=Pseudidiomarina sp. CB1 TaxID=2972484 RepID=UPI0021634375|nr:radical SAM family heme chaperone HemW [Pseudidiomarina sp. CB1]
MNLPPLSLYIHIPWCVQKCPYCDFNSHALKGGVPEDAYVARLLDDLRADHEWVQGRTIASIFIGGGTPSLLTPQAVARLLQGVATQLSLAKDCEVTLEANPGTFEQERFAGFIAAGVNRLSIGVQSLNAEQLQRLGRIHDPDQALTAAHYAKQLPLQSFNLDLMHGLPEQSIEQAMADLDAIIALEPPHISWYQLTIEPNTSFASRPPGLPEDDILAEINEQGHAKLLAAGYENYEVSAYAKPNHQSRHNRNYWQFGDYLGIGCGAHGKISLPDSSRIIRSEKIKHPQGYLDLTRPLRYRTWDVSTAELPFEFFMNLLRLAEPIPKNLFTERTGLPLAVAETSLAPAITKGLMEDSPTEWKTTPLGRRFLNSILDEMV